MILAPVSMILPQLDLTATLYPIANSYKLIIYYSGFFVVGPAERSCRPHSLQLLYYSRIFK
jgi:hypothetical protein